MTERVHAARGRFERGAVAHVSVDRAPRQPRARGMTREDDGLVAAIGHRADDRAAEVPGPARDQHAHTALSYGALLQLR